MIKVRSNVFYKNSDRSFISDLTVSKNVIFLEEIKEQIYLDNFTFSLGGDNNSYFILENDRFSIFIKYSDQNIQVFIDNSNSSLTEKFLEIKQNNMKNNFFLSKGSLSLLLKLCLTLFFLGIVFIYIMKFSFGLMISNFPLSIENKIGQSSLESIISDKNVIKNVHLKKVIDEIAYTLIDNSGVEREYNYDFYVIKSDEVNAFALPGGKVVIYSGLILETENLDELAGVLAHELQHVYQKHGIKKILNQIGVMTFISVFTGYGSSNIIKEIANDLLLLKFDRSEELKADELGLELLYKADVNPYSMISFFEKLAQSESINVPQLFLTHPNTDSRIKHLESLINNKYQKRDYKKFNIDWDAIKSIIKNVD